MRSAVFGLVLLAALVAAEVIYSDYLDERPKRKGLELKQDVRSRKFAKVKIQDCPAERAGADTVFYSKCTRFQLKYCKNKGFPDKGGCFRNEIALPKDIRQMFVYGNTYWIGHSLYVPEKYQPDRLKTIHFQIHATGGPLRAFSPHSPLFALQDVYGYWSLRIAGSDDCNEYGCFRKTHRIQFLAPVKPGWVDFILVNKISYEGDGKIMVYMNGQKIWEKDGLYTAFKEPGAPAPETRSFPKYGVYKHQWGEGYYGDPKNKDILDTLKADMTKAALVIAEGEDESNKELADTRPRCSGAAGSDACCQTCINGIPNVAFTHSQCGLTPSTAATTLQQACSKCVNGAHNPMYNEDKCFEICQSNTAAAEFDQYCFQTLQNVCGTSLDICDAETGAVCEQDGHTYHCKCPDGWTQSGKLAAICVEESEKPTENEED